MERSSDLVGGVKYICDRLGESMRFKHEASYGTWVKFISNPRSVVGMDKTTLLVTPGNGHVTMPGWFDGRTVQDEEKKAWVKNTHAYKELLPLKVSDHEVVLFASKKGFPCKQLGFFSCYDDVHNVRIGVFIASGLHVAAADIPKLKAIIRRGVITIEEFYQNLDASLIQSRNIIYQDVLE